MNSYLQIHSIIKISYVFNSLQETISIDSVNSLQVLKNVISLSKKIKFKDYCLYYNNKKLDEQSDTIPIKAIISKDLAPIFFVVKKNDNQKLIQMEEVNSHKYNYVLKLESYPTKFEVLDIVNKFMDKQVPNEKTDYIINIKNQQILICFKNKVYY